ncbi:MAG TPA: serine/threonine-protein kinase [Myxococcales bacterium]|jgi:serine/threonine-protein kinase
MGIPFGRYELLKRIAAGGMGEVFLARQVGMQGFEKLLVVKVLLPHLVEDQEFVTMFFDEARIAARLNHPNVAQIFDLGDVEGSYYIAMEYIHGDDVVRLWKTARTQEKPVPLPLVVRIAADAAAGLDYAHKATDANNQPLGLVHRDVSPQNILVTFDGGVKLIDFGVAKAAGRASHTATGTLKGKYSYMSPEQASGKPIDARSDVFALGVVLYEMATSLRLFKRETEISTLKAVEACEIPRPSETNPEIDEQLEAVMMKALARDANERYQDAAALRLALEDWAVQKRASASSAHLSAYMQGLYADRLAAERAEGKPFSEFEGTPSAIFRRGPGSKVAQAASSESSTEAVTPSERRGRKPKSKAPLFAGLGAAALALVAGLAFALWPKPSPVTPPPAVEPAASLTVSTRPAGAKVVIDGASAGVSPIDKLPLTAGKRVSVEIVMDGFQAVRQDVIGQGAQRIDLALVKIEAPPTPPPPAAEVVLKLASHPSGATVSLGDEVLGKTPLEHKLAKSQNEVTFLFKLAGHRPEKKTVTPSSDAEVKATLAKAGGGGGKPPPPQPPPGDLGIKTGR